MIYFHTTHHLTPKKYLQTGNRHAMMEVKGPVKKGKSMKLVKNMLLLLTVFFMLHATQTSCYIDTKKRQQELYHQYLEATNQTDQSFSGIFGLGSIIQKVRDEMAGWNVAQPAIYAYETTKRIIMAYLNAMGWTGDKMTKLIDWITEKTFKKGYTPFKKIEGINSSIISPLMTSAKVVFGAIIAQVGLESAYWTINWLYQTEIGQLEDNAYEKIKSQKAGYSTRSYFSDATTSSIPKIYKTKAYLLAVLRALETGEINGKQAASMALAAYNNHMSRFNIMMPWYEPLTATKIAQGYISESPITLLENTKKGKNDQQADKNARIGLEYLIGFWSRSIPRFILNKIFGWS